MVPGTRRRRVRNPRLAMHVSALIPRLVANLPLILLSAALLVGAIWAYRTWREMRGEDDDADDSPVSLLEQIRLAHAAGELDDAEYQRVRRRLLKLGPEEPNGSASKGPDAARPPRIPSPTMPDPSAELSPRGGESERVADVPPETAPPHQ